MSDEKEDGIFSADSASTGSSATLTIEKMKQAIKIAEENYERDTQIEPLICGNCGERFSEARYRIAARFKKLEKGVYVCCDKCLFGDL